MCPKSRDTFIKYQNLWYWLDFVVCLSISEILWLYVNAMDPQYTRCLALWYHICMCECTFLCKHCSVGACAIFICICVYASARVLSAYVWVMLLFFAMRVLSAYVCTYVHMRFAYVSSVHARMHTCETSIAHTHTRQAPKSTSIDQRCCWVSLNRPHAYTWYLHTHTLATRTHARTRTH